MAPKRKQKESAPRLDEKGYLEVDPGGVSLPATWVGESIGSEVIAERCQDDDVDIRWEATLYGAGQYGDRRIKVGDPVCLTPEEKGEAGEIGVITKMYEVDDTDFPKRMSVNWLWRPEALQIADPEKEGGYLKVKAHDRELFLTSDTDHHNYIDTIESQ